MDKEAVQLSEINGALAALTNKQRQIEQNPKEIIEIFLLKAIECKFLDLVVMLKDYIMSLEFLGLLSGNY